MTCTRRKRMQAGPDAYPEDCIDRGVETRGSLAAKPDPFDILIRYLSGNLQTRPVVSRARTTFQITQAHGETARLKARRSQDGCQSRMMRDHVRRAPKKARRALGPWDCGAAQCAEVSTFGNWLKPKTARGGARAASTRLGGMRRPAPGAHNLYLYELLRGLYFLEKPCCSLQGRSC